MRIAFVTTDWSPLPDDDGFPTLGGSAHYRVGLPYEALKANGYDVHLGAHLGRKEGSDAFIVGNWRQEMVEDVDVVVLHRWMERGAPDAIRRARSEGQLIINDVDDHFDGLTPDNHAWRTTHPRANAESNRAHYRKVIGASSAITASTPFLQRWYQEKYHKETVLLRNAIDLDEPWPKTYLGGLPVVGWAGMTSVRSRDLEVVAGVVESFLNAHMGRFHHSGHYEKLAHAQVLLNLQNIVCTTSPAVTTQHIPDLYGKFNIGIVPLNDIPFNEAKSCIKGMEYAASGIPFVASASPEYEWLTAQGIGLLARKPKHWKYALERLADEGERVRLAEQAREALKPLCLSNRYQEWPEQFATLLANLR